MKKIMVNNAVITIRSTKKSENKEDFKWKRCQCCDSLFISARKSALYCSDKCRTEWHLHMKKYINKINANEG
jgi:hypothetical protein